MHPHSHQLAMIYPVVMATLAMESVTLENVAHHLVIVEALLNIAIGKPNYDD